MRKIKMLLNAPGRNAGLFEPVREPHLITEDSPSFIVKTANESIAQLEQMQYETGKEIPMSDYAQILIWEANTLKQKFYDDIQAKKRQGYTFSDHTFCGVPINEFEIKSLGFFKQI